MALYIGFSHDRDVCWHVGSSTPRLPESIYDVLEVQADGDELQWIFDNFTNLPRSWTGRVQTWYGDHAKFIVGTIMKKA